MAKNDPKYPFSKDLFSSFFLPPGYSLLIPQNTPKSTKNTPKSTKNPKNGQK
jgi:hypothetical protein